MARKFAAILLIALALATLAVYARAVMAPLTLSIGTAPIALVQQSVESDTITGTVGPVAFSLPVASTAGTTLIAEIGIGSATEPLSVVSFPAGFVRLATSHDAVNATLYETWVYLNNPGGILAFSAQIAVALGARWYSHVSEWSGVLSASALTASGTATVAAGTTLTLTTTTAVVGAGDLAIAGWIHAMAAPAAITFTTPSGWTRLFDTGSLNRAAHLDLEYLTGPPAALLAATLTASNATTTAAGAIVVLKAAPPVTDQTAYLAY